MSEEKSVISAVSLDRYRHIFVNLQGAVASAPKYELSEMQAHQEGNSSKSQLRRSGRSSPFDFGFNKKGLNIEFASNTNIKIPFLPCWFLSMIDLLLDNKLHDQNIDDIVNRERLRRSTAMSYFIHEHKENLWHERRLLNICQTENVAKQIAKSCYHYSKYSPIILVRWTDNKNILPDTGEFISVFELALSLMRFGVRLSDYLICAEDALISLSDAAKNGIVNDSWTNNKTMSSTFARG